MKVFTHAWLLVVVACGGEATVGTETGAAPSPVECPGLASFDWDGPGEACDVEGERCPVAAPMTGGTGVMTGGGAAYVCFEGVWTWEASIDERPCPETLPAAGDPCGEMYAGSANDTDVLCVYGDVTAVCPVSIGGGVWGHR